MFAGLAGLTVAGAVWCLTPHGSIPQCPRAVITSRGYLLKFGLNPTGKLLATLESEQLGGAPRLHVWDAATGDVRWEFLRPGEPVESFAFSPDSCEVAALCRDGVRVWDVVGGTEGAHLRTPEWLQSDDSRTVTYTPDGRLVVVGMRKKEVTLWDADRGHAVPTLAALDGDDLAWRVDEGVIEVWAGDGVSIYDLFTGDPLGTVPLPDRRWSYVTSCARAARLFAVADGDHVRFWELSTGRTSSCTPSAEGEEPPRCWAPALSSDGRLLSVGVLPARKRRPLWLEQLRSRLGRHPDEYTDSQLRVYDRKSGWELARLPANATRFAAHFSRDGSALAVGYLYQGEVQVYDIPFRKPFALIAALGFGVAGAVYLAGSVPWFRRLAAGPRSPPGQRGMP